MQVIKFEQRDAVGHIVLDNPPKNLIASDFSNSLKQAVHEASESDIRALLVRAEGPNFSQGGDVLDFLEKNAHQFRTFIAECNQSFRAVEALQIPTVAAFPGVLGSMSLIPIGGSDLTTFHTCLSAWELKTTLVSIRAVNKIHSG